MSKTTAGGLTAGYAMPRSSTKQKYRANEASYARDLRSIAKEIGRIINSFDPRAQLGLLTEALKKYEDILLPWSMLRARKMVEQSDRENRRIWANTTKEMSQAIRMELQGAPVGQRMRDLMAAQVELIQSLPRKAAERVHELVKENVFEQQRSTEIAKEIRRSGEVTEARATLIARTEVSRAASVLTQARAEYIGSEGYIWRTVKDADVRPSHKKMEGKFVRWSEPPTLDGLTGHAGALPNCRCYIEPVIPEELLG